MKTYLLRDIPPGLWMRVRRRARADRLKLKALLLVLLEAYADGRLTVRGRDVGASVTAGVTGRAGAAGAERRARRGS